MAQMILFSNLKTFFFSAFFSHRWTSCFFFYTSDVLRFLFIFLIQNSRELTARIRVDTVSREPAQPGCPLAKSSFRPFLRMQPPLPSLRQWAPRPSRPTAHTLHTALFTWSTLCWLSCKCSFLTLCSVLYSYLESF